VSQQWKQAVGQGQQILLFWDSKGVDRRLSIRISGAWAEESEG
jgi:hypothetical protein